MIANTFSNRHKYVAIVSRNYRQHVYATFNYKLHGKKFPLNGNRLFFNCKPEPQ